MPLHGNDSVGAIPCGCPWYFIFWKLPKKLTNKGVDYNFVKLISFGVKGGIFETELTKRLPKPRPKNYLILTELKPKQLLIDSLKYL